MTAYPDLHDHGRLWPNCRSANSPGTCSRVEAAEFLKERRSEGETHWFWLPFDHSEALCSADDVYA